MGEFVVGKKLISHDMFETFHTEDDQCSVCDDADKSGSQAVVTSVDYGAGSVTIGIKS
jgi:hypothetical protein